MSFDIAFKQTVGVEGGYSNNPLDPGGETKYGITVRVARANGYTGPMRDLPLTTAKDIYRRQYWDVLSLNDINAVCEYIAEEMFDTGVNMGVGTVGKFLQRALNVLNRDGKDFRDLEVDGIIGPVTVAAMREYFDHRGDQGMIVLLRLLDGFQAVRYVEIAEKDDKREAFVFGWVLNRVGNCHVR